MQNIDKLILTKDDLSLGSKDIFDKHRQGIFKIFEENPDMICKIMEIVENIENKLFMFTYEANNIKIGYQKIHSLLMESAFCVGYKNIQTFQECLIKIMLYFTFTSYSNEKQLNQIIEDAVCKMCLHNTFMKPPKFEEGDIIEYFVNNFSILDILSRGIM